MTYILTYKISGGENKLAQIEAEGYNEAQKKVEDIFAELESIGKRKHVLVDLQPLNSIRKLDVLD